MTLVLPADFFARDTVTVAQTLLGMHLMCWDEIHQDYLAFRVVETEAYTQDDPSCHAFKGPRGRGVTLYKAPGLAYVYFIYGMYYCLNVVTEPTGRAGAVLFRALEPLHPPTGAAFNTKGPGRLCKALGITKALHNELPLSEINPMLYLAPGDPVPPSQIVTTTRIGISVAQDYPWRFYIQDNPWVSVKANLWRKPY